MGQAALEQLRHAAIEAIADADFPRGEDLVEGLRLLSDWLNQGGVGEMPVDVAALLDGAVTLRNWSEQEMEDLLRKAQQEVAEARYGKALPRLNLVIQQAGAGALRERAQEAMSSLQRERERRLQELVAQAKKIAEESREDFVAQRQAWQAVLDFQPGHRESLEALDRLALEESRARVRRQIDAFGEPLRALRKDVRQVEEAWQSAGALLQEGTFPDADLHGRLQSVYQQLGILREEMLQMGAEAAANERAGNYEAALRTYTTALCAGFAVLVDCPAGQPIVVAEALEQVRRKYFDELKIGILRCYREWQEYLAAGDPETAIAKMEGAQELARKIEEGGEAIRRKLDDALTQARVALKSKQEAHRLVEQAQQDGDPARSRLLLLQAREMYENYPGLETLLQENERLLLAQVVQDMDLDLSSARSELARACVGEEAEEARAGFERAREHCRVALNRGATLAFDSSDWQALRQEAERLLEEIDDGQRTWDRFWRQLQWIDRAIQDRDFRLAQSLLDSMADEERRDARVLRRQECLARLKEPR